MSNSKDEKPLGKSLEQDKSYAVGNKKPPVEHQFKKGVSGDLKGRPKGGSKEKALGDLGDLVMKDFYKPVWVNINGKTVKKSPAEIFAQHMVKDAIKKGGAATKFLLEFIEEHEAREARREELNKKKKAEGYTEIDWDAEKEKVYQRLMRATEDTLQVTTPTNEPTTPFLKNNRNRDRPTRSAAHEKAGSRAGGAADIIARARKRVTDGGR
jgi:hypothetical protein